MRDDYRALVEDARDALHGLLRETAPGTGLTMHYAYNELRRMLEEADRPPAPPKPVPYCETNEFKQHLRQKEAWRDLPRAEKHHMVRNALGDSALIVSQITERMQEAHGSSYPIYDTAVRVLANELVEQGELERVKELRVPGGTAWRWRYSRRASLSPEVEALQRALDRDEEDDDA